jgi:TonB-dependent SusC/RagA subfamily outer membrane receptor
MKSAKKLLWQIGKPDASAAEFACSATGYRTLKTPDVFVIGQSTASEDWPFALPGFIDDWCDPSQKTNTIVFDLKEVDSKAKSELIIAFTDWTGGTANKQCADFGGQASSSYCNWGDGGISFKSFATATESKWNTYRNPQFAFIPFITTGQPGAGANIVIRGGTTLRPYGTSQDGSGIGGRDASDPLVVVDGVFRNFNDVNPDDIESIQVMKDAASTAICGARGANGVIVIKTKTGKGAGTANFTFRYQHGIETQSREYDYLNAREYIGLSRPVMARGIDNYNVNTTLYTTLNSATVTPFTAKGQYGVFKYTTTYIDNLIAVEVQDAHQFAAWGFDFLKYDWCSYGEIAQNPDDPRIPAPINGKITLEGHQYPHKLMGDILKNQNRDIVLNLCQMDARKLKNEFGNDIVFWGGGVDTQKTLPFGTPEEVYREVRERIEIFGDGGGFVFNPIHNIQGNVPVENILSMFRVNNDIRGISSNF